MDLILKPVVYKVITYVEDSFHFSEMLERKIDFQSTFVTFNITSLYTNISHDLVLETIKNFCMTGRCPFFKKSLQPGKETNAFQYPVSEFLD